MARSHSRHGPVALFARALCGTACHLALLAALAQPALGAEQPARLARVEVGAPEGFDTLTGPQKALVDVYFGDRRVGQATVTYQPGSLRFDEPAAVIALLPELADPDAVRAALAQADLPSHASRICAPGSDAGQCGRITPEVAGVIFDEQRFRIDIFINPRLLQVSRVGQAAYLPPPQAGLSVINAFSGVLSGSSRGENVYNLQNRLLIGESDRRLRAEFGYSSGFGVQADRIVAEIDRPGWRFSGGAFWTPGSSLVGRRKILGIGAETQFDTRLDRDEMRGTPLVVFLGQRAKVDILRDGRAISSRVYEAGNQALDTGGLPDGAYEVVLRIEEAGGTVREERRFFSRNRQIAPVGQAIYFAYAGVLVDDLSRAFLSPTGTPFAQLGGGWRLSPRIAVDANLMATDKAVVAELGATWISRAAQLRLGAIVSSNGARGGFFHAGSSGNSRLNFDFDLRHVRSSNDDASLAPGIAGGEMLAPGQLARLPVARRTFTQLAGSITYSLKRGQLGVAAAWRRERGQAATYSVGPWVRWDLVRRGPWQLAFQGDYSASNEGKAGFAGLSLRYLGGNTSFGGDAGVRTRQLDGASSRSGAVGSLSASWNRAQPSGTDIELAGGYERDLDHELVNGHAVIRNGQAELGGDVIHALGGKGSGLTQYSLGVQTTIALRGDTLALVGKNPNDSMIMVGVDGGGMDGRFDVLVNDMLAGTVRSGGKLSVAVAPYRQYAVRIRPTGSALLHYDGAARKIGLYPGNVARLDWSVSRLAAMFGRLVLADGSPVSGAQVRGQGGIGQSDDNGFFQIEAAEGALLTAILPDGRSCDIQPPPSGQGEQFVRLGTMVCNPRLGREPITTALGPTSGHAKDNMP